MLHQLLALQNVHDTPAVLVPIQPVGQLQVGFAEEDIAALILQGQQSALDGTDGLGRNVAVGQLILGSIVTNVLHHAAQILQVDQQQALVIGDAEDDPQNAALGVVQAQQPGQ